MARSSIAPLLFALCALCVTACSDDYGEPCDLPNSAVFEQYCETTTDDEEGRTSATCVFTNSTQCESRMCAQYIGSRGFCSEECAIDEATSCPSGSVCQVVPATELAFCVPPTILESVE